MASESGLRQLKSCRSFKDRIEDEYAGLKNFYALSYNRDEVIDAVNMVSWPSWLSLTFSGAARERCSFHQPRLRSESRGPKVPEPWGWTGRV